MKKAYLRVEKINAEKIRRRLIALGLLDENFRVKRNEKWVYFPLMKDLNDLQLPGKIIFLDAEKQGKRATSLKDALRNKLNERELKVLHKSFDIVGDIAILDIPEQLKDKEKIIAETLLKLFKNIRVVVKKEGKVDGKFRTRAFSILAGENRTITKHKEHGCIYLLDIEKAYFSPRLGNERLRIANQVKDGEKVLVMFAGIGPYAILIAKKRNAKVYAIELNPNAIEYMKKNVELNKVNVNVISGDVREETPKLVAKVGKFDRIIMPLPKGADNFLDVALKAIKNNGIIHFYCFSKDEKEAKENLLRICEELGYSIKIKEIVKCGSFSPGINRICIDFEVEKL
ncbi:MAG TPA: class I SAM-dependent methyltransferase family protein [Candidatus Altiarchaeales archaeon]|nr:class I SAM-dependent methyltransferase family protein [Candidatus Altiarchaeales archaeon]